MIASPLCQNKMSPGLHLIFLLFTTSMPNTCVMSHGTLASTPTGDDTPASLKFTLLSGTTLWPPYYFPSLHNKKTLPSICFSRKLETEGGVPSFPLTLLSFEMLYHQNLSMTDCLFKDSTWVWNGFKTDLTKGLILHFVSQLLDFNNSSVMLRSLFDTCFSI